MSKLDDVGGARGGCNRGTKTENKSSRDEVALFVGGSLNSSANEDNSASDEDAPPPPNAISEQAAD